MTADRIMQTAFWVLRLMTVNMTVSCSLLYDVRVIAVLALRHGKPLPGYSNRWIAGELRPDTGERAAEPEFALDDTQDACGPRRFCTSVSVELARIEQLITADRR
jgi:hypothetical protein